jgi:hypothetical protein
MLALVLTMVHSRGIEASKPESTMSNQVTCIKSTVFGAFGVLNGREVEFCRATRMWAYTDGSGYAYGAHS